MENDPLDHWTQEDERAFQEYCQMMAKIGRGVTWKATRLIRLPLPESGNALDNLLEVTFSEC